MLEVQIEKDKIYIPLKETWHKLTPEEEVRQNFICELVNEYGYSLEQMDQEIKVTNSDRGTGRASADIVVWKSKDERVGKKTAFMVIECKAEEVGIREKDFYQGYNYATWARAKIFVASNLLETKVFKVIEEELPLKLSRVAAIPHCDDIQKNEDLEKILSQTQVFKRDEFAQLLFQCHSVIRDNDKLSPEAAFDEISKILFMKILYERNPSKHTIFSLKKFEEDEAHYEENVRPQLEGPDRNIPYFQILFRRVKNTYKKADLFDINERINIRESSFKQIVKMLEIYNLSETSEDIKGIAFEDFLGRTFRGELGQFFTPRTVVDFMVELLNPKEGELVCDPCCGSGGFLIKSFEHVREQIEQDIDKQKDVIKAEYLGENLENLDDEEANKIVDEKLLKLNKELVVSKDLDKIVSRIDKLSKESIYGTDANPRMARVSKMNMIMHGDGHGGVHHNDGLLNVNGIFENRFDVIVTNPPFGSRVTSDQKIEESDKYTDTEKIAYYTEKFGDNYTRALKQIEDNIGESIVDLYEVGEFSGLTEILFIERCLNLLKPNGRMGIVLPEGVLDNTNLDKVRKFFEKKAAISLVVSLPSELFLKSGATVKTSILFMRKFTESELATIKSIEDAVIEYFDEQRGEVQRELTEVETDIENAKDTIKELKRRRRDRAETDKEQIEADLLHWTGIEQGLKDRKKEVKKEITKRLKELNKQQEIAIEEAIKKDFDYEIPMAEIEKAGIDSQGRKIANQLPALLKEYREYQTSKEAENELSESV